MSNQVEPQERKKSKEKRKGVAFFAVVFGGMLMQQKSWRFYIKKKLSIKILRRIASCIVLIHCLAI